MKQPAVYDPSVRELQRMLNQAARHNPQFPHLAEDGLFGERTLEAVMLFQRDYFPPVTGVVDYGVWYALVDLVQSLDLQFGPPALLQVFPHGRFSTPYGGSSEQMRSAQALMNSLAAAMTNLEANESDGRNAGRSTSNLRAIQKLAGLPVSGELNRSTWEFLTRLYHAYITRASLSASVSDH